MPVPKKKLFPGKKKTTPRLHSDSHLLMEIDAINRRISFGSSDIQELIPFAVEARDRKLV